MSRVLAIDTETTGTDLYIGKDLAGQSDAMPFAVSACDDEGSLFYWDFSVDYRTRRPILTPSCVKEIKKCIDSYDTWVFHNANFDIRSLTLLFDSNDETKGYMEDVFFKKTIHDTLIASHIIDSDSPHGLKPLAVRYLDIDSDDETELHNAVNDAKRFIRSKKATTDWGLDVNSSVGFWFPNEVAKEYRDAPKDWRSVCETYAIKDVERTISLHLLFQEQLKELDKLNTYHRELQLIPVVLNIQKQGLHLFKNKGQEVLQSLRSEIEEATKELTSIAQQFFPEVGDLNLNSSKQLSELLYGKFQLPVLFLTAKNSPSVDAASLNGLYDMVLKAPNNVARFGKWKKEVATFLSKLLEMRLKETTSKYIENYLYYSHDCLVGTKSRRSIAMIYPNLNQTGTSTTRFSSSNPNGQNISTGVDEQDDQGNKIKKFNLRELFGPRPGCKWYTIDYKSLQLIIFAYESGDAGMIDAFQKGYDFHNYVACGLFATDNPTSDQRRIAKNVNYALIFGAGKGKVDATAGMPGAYELYENQFPIVRDYMAKVMRQVRKYGYVETAFGYPLVVPRNQPYKGVNYIVQGDEGNIVKQAMINCFQFLEKEHPKVHLIMQIHDELVFECPKNYDFPLTDICSLMEKPAKDIGWSTPVDASLVTSHWGNKEKIGG